MQVKINRCVMLGGKTYRNGVHEVPDGDLRGWFAEALLASGAIVPAETQQRKSSIGPPEEMQIPISETICSSWVLMFTISERTRSSR